MDPTQVEALCKHLSPLLKNTIRSKILKHECLPEIYLFGEALSFWLADMLIGVNLLAPDQIRVLLEEFHDRIMNYGEALAEAWKQPLRGMPDLKKLPMCKIGFLDRQLACMDGVAYFLNLQTGERVPATDNWPLETLAYNLATLFVRYEIPSKRSHT